jgi:hypothetical protein
MGRSYSLDLRRRVIDRITGGQSRCGAAKDVGERVVRRQADSPARAHRLNGACTAGAPAGHGQAGALSRLPDRMCQGEARHHHAGAGGRATRSHVTAICGEPWVYGRHWLLALNSGQGHAPFSNDLRKDRLGYSPNYA